MSETQELRCNDCGALVTDEHLALAKETEQAPYCPDCWGENLLSVTGDQAKELAGWNEYLLSLHPFGEEPTVCCDFCGKRIEAADAARSAFDGKPLCGRCKDSEESVLYA